MFTVVLGTLSRQQSQERNGAVLVDLYRIIGFSDYPVRPVNEPLAVIPAMAAATESLGFGVTISTTYEQPYHLARRISTIDHLTGGRYV